MAITVDIKHRQSPVHIEYFPFQTAPTLNSIKTENYIKVFYVGFICWDYLDHYNINANSYLLMLLNSILEST